MFIQYYPSADLINLRCQDLGQHTDKNKTEQKSKNPDNGERIDEVTD